MIRPVLATVALLSIHLFLLTDVVHAEPTQGLIGYWALDGTSGTTAVDSSPSGNNASLINGPAVWMLGKIGNALFFDGADDYLLVGDPVTIRPGSGFTTSVTLAAWMKLNNLSSNRYIIAKGDDALSNATYLRYKAGGGVTCAIGGTVATAVTSVATGQWYHVLCEYDGDAVTLYLNGAVVKSVVKTGTVSDETGIGWLIGARTPANPAALMSGRLDDVRIYDRALTSTEVGQLYSATTPDTIPPVLTQAAPSGNLPFGTTTTTLSLASGENATCRYSTTPGVAYGAMVATFSTTGGTLHSQVVSGLSAGGSYSYYVRCADSFGNATTSDDVIAFAIDQSAPFQTIGNWSTFSPVANHVTATPVGFNGGIFDGRYVYFVPHLASPSEVMRYDTLSPFNAAGSWQTYDPHPPSGGGYVGAAFDGRYIYFAPRGPGGEAYIGEVLRYDVTQPFDLPGSWATFDLSANGVGLSLKGYWGAFFDGRYLYLSPEWAKQSPSVVRYDTTRPFASASSWKKYNPGAHGLGTDPHGYKGIVSDGRYLYFVPYYNTTGSHGEVLRYDTLGAFDVIASWSAYIPANDGVGNIAKGFEGAVWDGARYIYFVPSYAGFGPNAYHGEVLRYDTASLFDTASSWAAFDPGSHGVGIDPDGYDGGTFDGRYIYFAPTNNGTGPHGEVLMYDTTLPFGSPGSWQTYDPGAHGVGVDPDGFAGTVFDGRYIYFVPDRHDPSTPGGEVMRFDTGIHP